MKHWFTRKKPSEKVLHPQMTYDIFHNRKKFKIDLMDTLVYTWLPTKEYEMFVRDRRYQDKWFDAFFDYFKEYSQEKQMKKKIAKEEMKQYFDEMIYRYIKMYINEFLQDKESSKTHEWCLQYFMKEKPFLLQAIEEEGMIKIYAKEYQEYLKGQKKNAFGLKLDDIERDLDRIFEKDGVGNGWFLYARENEESSGIEKYLHATENKKYKDIKPTEAGIYELLMAKDGDPRTHAKVYDLLSKSKTIVEIGPGWVDKLLETLEHFSWWEEWLSSLLSEKRVKLLDIAPEGYVSVKQNILDAIKQSKVECIEGNMLDETSSAYNNIESTSYFMFGGTIGNFSFDEIVQIFKNMRSKNALKSNSLFLTYFVAPQKPDKKKIASEEEYEQKQRRYEKEKEDLVSMYTGPWQEDFILSWLEALGIPRNALKHRVEYDEATANRPARIKAGAEFTRDVEIVTPTGKKYTKKKGEHIRAIQSARFTEEDIQSLAKKAWYTLTINADKYGTWVAVLQSTLGMHDRYRKARNIIWWVLIWSALLWGYYTTKNIVYNNQIQQERQHQQKTELKDRSIYTYGDMYGVELKTMEEKEKFVESIVQDVIQSIQVRYGIGKIDMNDIESLVKDKLFEWNTIDNFFDGDSRYIRIVEFADEFVNQHKNYMLQYGADIVPYKHLQEYEEKFKNTINVEMTYEEAKEKFSITYSTYMWDIIDVSGTTTHLWWYQSLTWGEYDVGTYTGKYPSSSFDIWLQTGKPDYIYATFYVLDVKEKQKYPHEYNLNESRVIAFDYFEQTRPVVSKILTYYYKVFHNKEYNKYEYNKYGWTSIQNDRREMIIRDLVNTEQIDEIDENDTEAIVEYVLWCLKRNKVQGEDKLSFIPYDTISHYEEALQNGVREFQKKWGIGYISEEQKQKFQFVYLGTYLTQKWEVYNFGEITIDGKKCIVGSDKNTPIKIIRQGEELPDTDYYTYVAKEIAEDYYDLKKKCTSPSIDKAKDSHSVFPITWYRGYTKKPDAKRKGYTPWLFKK